MINSNIGYIICESESEPSAVLQPKTINGKVVAECILQTADEKNRNGRYYSEEELFPQLIAPRTLELLKSGTLKAECGHPLSKDLQRQSTIDDTKTCARFLKLWTEGKNIMAHVVATNNDLGRAFDLDLKEGILPAWSLRALGSIEQTRRGCEVKNLRLITWDNVIYPSHPGAYTQKLVSESTASGIIVPKNNLQTLVESTDLLAGNDVALSEANDLAGNASVYPVLTEDIKKFIMTESSNLKFVRECFDFVYSGITVNESGTKVILTANDGDTIVVNLESYIHDELMRYDKQYDRINESSEEKFSIRSMISAPVTESIIDEEPVDESADDIISIDESVFKKIAYKLAHFVPETGSKLIPVTNEIKGKEREINNKFNTGKLPLIRFAGGRLIMKEGMEILDEGLFTKKKEAEKDKDDPRFPIKVGKFQLAVIGEDSKNRPIYYCTSIVFQGKMIPLMTSDGYSPLSSANLEIMRSFVGFVDKNFKSMADSVISTAIKGASISSFRGIRSCQCIIDKNKEGQAEIEVFVGLNTSVEGHTDNLGMIYKYNFVTKKEGLYSTHTEASEK